MRAPRAVGAALVAAGLVASGLLAGCTTAGSGRRVDAARCPAARAQPRADRPQVTLSFTVAADLASLTGTEQVVFTPDRPVTELVFRLVADTPSGGGTGIRVLSATSDHGDGTVRYERAGAAAGTPGGLLHVPLRGIVPAGTTVRASLAFTVRIGPGGFDRIGRAGGFAWFGSAQPLLAWQDGVGWRTEPLAAFPAESATSEAARTDLTVVAPQALTVAMSGTPTSGTPVAGGARRWHATLDGARDVAVAVGPFAVTDTRVGAVRLRVVAPTAARARALQPDYARAVTALAARLGPYPFPSLTAVRLPGSGGGIEYPGLVLALDDSPLVTVHETAHQWFYALVGDDQARHPWLDEAFASWAEQLVDGDPPPALQLDQPGAVDTALADYGTDASRYYAVTYGKGAAALHAARAAAGPAAFDAAVRCYVDARAWRIAEPADVRTALAPLPTAVDVLRRAGALP